jgi:ribosomal protein S18 acetylase RimI-like enzyme
MKIFRSLVQEPQAERFIPEVLPWLYEAGNPYFDWLFGGREPARERLETWMRRTSAEVSILRVTLLCDGGCAVGGFLALGGAEVMRCRKADLVALLMKEKHGKAREELLTRIAAVRDLFPVVEDDEFYLSKIGVVPGLRRGGQGRELALEYLAAGSRAGFQRFRLDVCAENRPAVHLYSSLGFRVARESVSTEAGMKYLSMVWKQDDA